jgi:hypothetical protein
MRLKDVRFQHGASRGRRKLKAISSDPTIGGAGDNRYDGGLFPRIPRFVAVSSNTVSMKNLRLSLPFFLTIGVLFTSGVVFAQVPNIPKQPPSDSALKNAEAAQKAAEKAEAAKKAADKATAASAAAEKAKAAQEASAKAQKASEKAESASVAADKAAVAQKAADKAAAAQKNAIQAEAAQKAASKADAAGKASDKAAATAVVEKAAVRQAAAEKLTAITSVTVQADAASKATQNAAKVSAATTSAPDVTRIRALNQPAPETKAGDGKKTPEFTVTGEPRNPIADRKAQEEAARSVRIPEPAAAAPAPTAADAIRLTKDTVRDGLADLEVAPEVASKLADDFVDPEKAPAARVRVEELANTSSDLQLVSVPEATRRKIIDEVSRSADPTATANEKVGEAATEEVFGKDVAVLVPADKRGKFREVFQNLADLRSGLETIGASPDDPEVVEAVKEGAVRGVTTREETRVIFESAGQKVLDRQGFSPAKKNEDFNARLGRLAKEQKVELERMKREANVNKTVVRAGVANAKVQSGAASVSQSRDVANNVAQSSNFKVKGGDGGGVSAGIQSTFGRNPKASQVATSGGALRGDGHGVGNDAAKEGGVSGSSGSGAGSGGNGGGNGGGSGTGSGSGSGTGDGTGGGSGGGGGGGGGSGKGDGEKDGEGGGDGGGGTGDTESHDNDNMDISGEGMTMETTTEEAAKAAGLITLNPLDDGGGNPMALSEKTGGRLGGSEARRQQRAVQLAGSGAGAGGPNPDGVNTAPTLLTPEEEANAARLIGMKTGGGVTNPNPNKTGGIAVTDRDLKELHLRGNGGAAGPTDTTAPTPPQDPKSPIGGLTPGPVPQGGNRIEGIQAPAVQVDRIDVSGQLQENVK